MAEVEGTDSLASLITWLGWNANQRGWQARIVSFFHILTIRLGFVESACFAYYRIKSVPVVEFQCKKIALTRSQSDGPENIIPVGKHVRNSLKQVVSDQPFE